jgi:hypothetical protein
MRRITAGIGLIVAGIITWGGVADAQRLLYRPRRTGRIPISTVAGATRGSQCTDKNCLTALLPPDTVVSPDRKVDLDHVPLTLSERPVFYFSIPKTKGFGRLKLFKLDKPSDQGSLVYNGAFPVDSEAGIMRVTLPPTVPSFEVGKLYRWELIVSDLEREGVLIGFVSRVSGDANLKKTLQETDPIKKAELLAAAGIWLDAVDLLASNNGTQQLKALLESVQLKMIASQVILPCCSLKN